MKKTIILFLALFLLLLLIAAGGMTYLYSASGNDHVRTYVEKKLKEQTGLPIAFQIFKLTRGHLYFVAVMGNEVSLGFDGAFDLLHRRLNGRYLLKASQAHYQHYTLRQANISGHIQGTISDIKLDGKGTLLEGPVTFNVNIRNQTPQDIVVQLRKLPLDELLALGGQSQIVHGQLNADIMLPSFGKQGSKGRALIRLAHAHFDSKVIQSLYHYTLPTDKTTLKGEVRANLEGGHVTFTGSILSNLISIYLNNGQANLTEKNAACDLSINTAELAPVTQNQLHGPLKLAGSFKHDALGTQIRARTASLGGAIVLEYTKSISAVLKNISLSKILHLIGQPDYAEGKLNGTLSLKTPKAKNGRYGLKVTGGKLHTKILNQKAGMSLPSRIFFTLDSRGNVSQGILRATSQLTSNVLNAALTQTRFELGKANLKTHYRLHIPNPLLLAGKNGKGEPVTLEGTVTQAKKLRIQGSAKGLGKRLAFDYAGTHLKVIADDVVIERLLASGGLPTYVSGRVDAQVDLTSLDPLQGQLSLRAPKLVSHPEAMKKLIDKPINTTLALAISGQAKDGTFYGKADLKSPLASLSLSQMTFDAQHATLSSPFDLAVPDLAKLQPLLDIKLNGSLATIGKIQTGEQIDLQGTTTSLDGKITYRYQGSKIDAKLQNVSLPKLLHAIDQPEQLLGIINGTLVYDTQLRKGQAHMTADHFQFKAGKLTSAVKLILRKDLTQVIYDRTSADANLNSDWINYRLKAKGRRSDFVIQDGKLNTQAKTNKASFGLRIDNVDVIGTIKGPINDPRVAVLPGKMLRNRIKTNVIEKVAPTIKNVIKNTAGARGKKILKKLPKLF